MSQKDGSESDIWEYKPLEKKKKTEKSSTVTTRKCTTRRSSKRDPGVAVQSPAGSVKAAHSGDDGPQQTSSPLPVQTDSAADQGPSSADSCPMCQMPFSFLVVQRRRWHVAECLDTPRDTCKECPDGLHCSSIIPNHYKKFNHTLLAHSRANSDEALLSLSQQAEASGETSLTYLTGSVDNEAGGFILESSQDSALSISSSSDHGVSLHSNHTETPQAKRKNGLLLLRSPGPEDLKKKKGWSSSSKNQNPISSSQESRTELSLTPVKAESGRQACEHLPENKPSPDYNDAISYSPLSEFPAETEVNMTECRKSLFNNEASENEAGDSPVLFDDSFSSEDEILSDFIDKLETNNAQVKEPSSSNNQLKSVSSLPPTNQLAASMVSENIADLTGEKASTSAISACKSSIQSPQSVVLERLRETILSSDHLPLKNLNDSSSQLEQPQTSSVVPSLQNSIVQSSQTMPPQRGQSRAGQASGLKQTDIGVFFGLKPLKEKVKEAPSGSNDFSAASTPTLGEKSGQRRPRRERQRKQNGTADASQGTDSVENGHVVNAQGEAGKGRARRQRGRWNRGSGDGEERVRQCPFYKKIPGTKFVIDAFRYGEIEGITAYFLTHFHSDHYGGLTKNSTLPIYCNKITGNLVKSKLKVAEQYVHILPMNTQVTVEGVRVIFLEANHCPGAAMLLFFLPDGQIVLHTGDFRADPSMETYPELLNCRVQTLYLDTTYCSPEYTFPKQQEVINFAANTAFELVTLHPRTLVVCGSYSVGKEKVFLALADVLGSKVCLSRDKYNTMCCLESEKVQQSITTDGKAAQVHVLPMMQLSFKKLQDYLARFSRQYDRLVAFKPTGWTFSQQVESVQDIQPQISGNICIYGIPYSEHSSFLELKRFVQWLRPFKIIPTVNNGSWDSRTAMRKCFNEWLTENKANP